MLLSGRTERVSEDGRRSFAPSTSPTAEFAAAGRCLGPKSRRRQHLIWVSSFLACPPSEGRERSPLRGKAREGSPTPRAPPNSSGFPHHPRLNSPWGQPGERSSKLSEDGNRVRPARLPPNPGSNPQKRYYSGRPLIPSPGKCLFPTSIACMDPCAGPLGLGGDVFTQGVGTGWG